MKKVLLLLSAIVVSMSMAAQMQVWSNGTIIFSHSQTDVDSISFGSPMEVKANYNPGITSLAGKVYMASLAGGNSGLQDGLFFLDDSHGYLVYSDRGSSTGSAAAAYNKIWEFTYVINGLDIQLTFDGAPTEGKIIGTNGLVFPQFTYKKDESTRPALFININR